MRSRIEQHAGLLAIKHEIVVDFDEQLRRQRFRLNPHLVQHPVHFAASAACIQKRMLQPRAFGEFLFVRRDHFCNAGATAVPLQHMAGARDMHDEARIEQREPVQDERLEELRMHGSIEESERQPANRWASECCGHND